MCDSESCLAREGWSGHSHELNAQVGRVQSRRLRVMVQGEIRPHAQQTQPRLNYDATLVSRAVVKSYPETSGEIY